MSRNSTAALPPDLGKWLALAAAAVAVGILPKNWQKGIATASALALLLKSLPGPR
jgi:hypothetical protein